jgi:hypothetical protein
MAAMNVEAYGSASLQGFKVRVFVYSHVKYSGQKSMRHGGFMKITPSDEMNLNTNT